MATTTATITLASSDIADNSISVSNTATLTKAGSTTGLVKTSGLRRRTFTAVTIKDLIDLDHFEESDAITDNGANKVYIKNIGTLTDQYVRVGIGDITDAAAGFADDNDNDVEEFGRLYGGDWMFIPYSAAYTSAGHVNNQDIFVAPSSTDSVTLEWMVIYE